MKDYGYKTMELTERIGARMTDLDEAIESIHYDPDKATAEDIETLKEIQKLVEKAARLAEKTAKRLA
ncbi:MAG: hypothetical protein SOR91_03935 [Hornefia butyriciproducens]|uniref:hypothetical protein n=1 Tax=Hornefia butyriciproducens TaxID=2652293 RepID=UPI002A76487A|nr:hypothetical protein [Hornefia butyriciproducens]MDY2990607.1 hypothetical protein [Hornefia butyriciproducens]